MSERYRTIDLSPYVQPGDENDDSDASLWRAFRNYKKAKKATHEQECRALSPKLETFGTLVRHSEYHYEFSTNTPGPIYDIWPSTGRWRARTAKTARFGGVAALIRHLEKKGK